VKLFSILPKDRLRPGHFFVLEGDSYILGPEWCRREADKPPAAAHGNAEQDSPRSRGDHAEGVYRVIEVLEMGGADRDTYGPFFIKLEPLDGAAAAALKAKQAGRTGIGIHGGNPGHSRTPNNLRGTYGCLMVSDDVVAVLAGMLKGHLAADRLVRYECRVIEEEQ
jgi:hypothetical protein